MSARKGKGFGLTQLRAPQPRAEPPDVLEIGEQRLPGAFEVAIEQVVADPEQPRRDWSYDGGDRRLQELADSIREFGIFQPLVVREDGVLPDRRTRYVIIAGGRRRAAAELADIRTLPILIRGEEGARLRVMQLIENLQRQELSPLDEARAYQELLDAETMTAPQLASRVHKSAQHIRTRLRILADQVIADAIARRQVPVSAAGIIQQLPDEEVLTFKERLRAGETLHMADVLGVRDRLRANGVSNPRSKGGGRFRTTETYPSAAPGLSAPPPIATTLPPPLAQEQKLFVPSQDEIRTSEAESIQLVAETRDLHVVAGHEMAQHPAVRRAVGRAVGEYIRRNLPAEARQQVEERLGELAEHGDVAEWLPAVYQGLLGIYGEQDAHESSAGECP